MSAFQVYTELKLQGETLRLLSNASLWLPQHHTLLIADVHIGKAGHFRSEGVAVPTQVANDNFQRIEEALKFSKAKRLIFLGDLFHSSKNKEWDRLAHWSLKHSQIHMDLVVGNHDNLGLIQELGIPIDLHSFLELGAFALSHEPMEGLKAYNLCGHLHPGVKLKGKGRSSLVLPCFHFGENRGVLPAFGAFTGRVRLPVGKRDRVYAIVENRVLKLR